MITADLILSHGTVFIIGMTFGMITMRWYCLRIIRQLKEISLTPNSQDTTQR